MMYEMNYRNGRNGNAYDPFREMEELHRSIFGEPVTRFAARDDLAEFRTDILDEGDYYLLQSDLPGFDKNEIHLNLNGDVLTIQAQRHSRVEDPAQKDKFVRRERSYGSYSRQFNVAQIDTDHIRASYENGVLTLVLPKKQAIRPQSRTLTID